MVTCLRPRPGSGVRFPGGGPGFLPLRGRSRRTQPRLEPSSHLSHALPFTPRAPLCMRPGALSCSSSLPPCPMADEPCWLTPLAGFVHRQPPGWRLPQRAKRCASDLVTSLSLRSTSQPPPCGAIGQPGLTVQRLRLARGSHGGRRSPGQRASVGPRLSRSGRSVRRAWLSMCCIALVELAVCERSCVPCVHEYHSIDCYLHRLSRQEASVKTCLK